MSTGIRRAGEIDFGQKYLYVIDEIQTLVNNIYGVSVLNSHINVSAFQKIDFVSVGVGPLTHSEDYVTCGEPDERLVGHVAFLAEQMGVEIPPMPTSTAQEFDMKNQFFGSMVEENQRVGKAPEEGEEKTRARNREGSQEAKKELEESTQN